MTQTGQSFSSSLLDYQGSLLSRHHRQRPLYSACKKFEACCKFSLGRAPGMRPCMGSIQPTTSCLISIVGLKINRLVFAGPTLATLVCHFDRANNNNEVEAHCSCMISSLQLSLLCWLNAGSRLEATSYPGQWCCPLAVQKVGFELQQHLVHSHLFGPPLWSAYFACRIFLPSTVWTCNLNLARSFAFCKQLQNWQVRMRMLETTGGTVPGKSHCHVTIQTESCAKFDISFFLTA